MKKIVMLILATVISLGLNGCQKPTQKPSEDLNANIQDAIDKIKAKIQENFNTTEKTKEPETKPSE